MSSKAKHKSYDQKVNMFIHKHVAPMDNGKKPTKAKFRLF